MTRRRPVAAAAPAPPVPTTIQYRASRGGLETLISVFGDGWTVHTRARTGPRGHTVWDASGNNWRGRAFRSISGWGRVSPRGELVVDRADAGDYRAAAPVPPDAFVEVMGAWLDALAPLWTAPARRRPPEGTYPFPEHPSPPFADAAAAEPRADRAARPNPWVRTHGAGDFEVKNLGWLLRTARRRPLERVELVATPGGARMVAFFENGHEYEADWNDFFVALEWLARPTFRGERLVVNGVELRAMSPAHYAYLKQLRRPT